MSSPPLSDLSQSDLSLSSDDHLHSVVDSALVSTSASSVCDPLAADEAKLSGNAAYANKDYETAVSHYSVGIARCPSDSTTRLITLYNNRAAARLQLKRYDQVIEDCSASLSLSADQPNPKALLRRSAAHENLDDLSSALADINSLLQSDPSNKDGIATHQRLSVLSKAKQEAAQQEMLTKLKELGNGILGKFGLSLDQFKATKDPNTGSYNINFKQ